MPLTGHGRGELEKLSSGRFKFIMFNEQGSEVECAVTTRALHKLDGGDDRAANDIFKDHRKKLYAAANRAYESAGKVLHTGEMLNVDDFL